MTPRQKLDTEYEIAVEKLQETCDHTTDKWGDCLQEGLPNRDAVARCPLCESRLYIRRVIEKGGNLPFVYMYVYREGAASPCVKVLYKVLDETSPSSWLVMSNARQKMQTREDRTAFAEWLTSIFGGRPLSEWEDLAETLAYSADKE